MIRIDTITARPARRDAGFSFLELLVVMGVMAVLGGLAIGFLTNVGKGSQMAQARRLVVETARRCVNASMGNQRAFFTLRYDGDGPEPNVILEAGIAKTVLTHQFEELTFASGARSPKVEGNVERAVGGGHTGSCARFKGGSLEFSAESLYAMTEGFQFEAWVRPESGQTTMLLVGGMDPADDGIIYEVALARAGNAPAYDVRLRLKLRDIGAATEAADDFRTWETKGAPVTADSAAWTHVAVEYDGRDVRIAVGGHSVPLRDGSTSKVVGGDGEKATGASRIAIPRSGIVKLTIGSGFRGLMDTFVLRGVFRSPANETRMPDRLKVTLPQLPLRVEYANGRLSGTGGQDIRIWFEDRAHLDDMPLRLTLGRAGTVDAKYVNSVPGVAAGKPTTGGGQ